MTEPRDMALAVVRRGLLEQTELLVALQYCGLLVPDALRELRATDDGHDLIDRILSVPPAPEPPYPVGPHERYPTRRQAELAHRARERQAMRAAGREGMARTRSPRVPGTDRTQFSDWVDGKIAWSPAVMGWADDDARADGYEDGRYD